MRHCLHLLTLIALLPLLITGCNKPKEVEAVRPVRTMVVDGSVHESTGVVTGQVTAHAYVNASFRVPGKLSQRMVSAGSASKTGQLLARLDDTVFKDSWTSAKADVSAAKAVLEFAEKLEKRRSTSFNQRRFPSTIMTRLFANSSRRAPNWKPMKPRRGSQRSNSIIRNSRLKPMALSPKGLSKSARLSLPDKRFFGSRRTRCRTLFSRCRRTSSAAD